MDTNTLSSQRILNEIENRIESYFKIKNPVSIYEPAKYAMSAGGKRIRPMLSMLFSGVVCDDPLKALDAGIAIEILHNFTLVHDDIMDESQFRRGKPTVHIKWDNSTAILAGDAMVGFAYHLLSTYKNSAKYSKMIEVFTNGLIEVCEGQAYDMDFNTSKETTVNDYLLMIDKKTAKILQTASLIGALAGNCSDEEYEIISNYSYNLGIAFQIQDDLLDISAEQEKLGKKIGLDIIEGKKTILILKARELASNKEDIDLINLFYSNNGLDESYIPTMKDLFYRLGILDIVASESKRYFDIAFANLEKLKDNFYRNELFDLTKLLMVRNF